VYERIGRLKQKYPSVHNYYEIAVKDDGHDTATGISCRHKTGEDPDKQAGIYFLRTSLKGNDETVLWSIYNTIREIEYVFRVLKTDLDLCPIFGTSAPGNSCILVGGNNKVPVETTRGTL
jgi:hypothetical protein